MKKISLTCMLGLVAAAGLLACTAEEMTPVPAPQAWFPNDAWFATDATHTTGYRLLQDPTRGIVNLAGNQLNWHSILAGLDGFSPFQPILLITTDTCPDLPQPTEEAASIADNSPVLVVDGNGNRIPWFGQAGDDPTICEIYPVAPFTEALSATVTVQHSFDGTLVGNNPLPVSWSFPIGTLANRIEPAYRLQAETLAYMERGTSLLTSLEKDPAAGSGASDALHTWQGFYTVPDFTGPDGTISFGADGKPEIWGTSQEQFYLIAPTSITQHTGAAPLIQYGHGLFGDPAEIFYGGQRELRNQTGGLFGAVAWGMAVRYFQRAISAIFEPTTIQTLGHMNLQSLMNKLIFTQVLRDEIAPRIAADLGIELADVVDYIGISQGGILGSPLMALSPDIRRAVLHVGGGSWTPMMTNSSNWDTYGKALAATVPDDTSRTWLMAIWQPIWDRWDPAIFAPYWVNGPSDVEYTPVHKDRQVYYPYAIDDPQVPNFSSELVLRAANAPLLQPSITDPLDLQRVSHPVEKPVVADQWDVGGGQPAHSDPRSLPDFAAKVIHFLRTGELIDTCAAKACVYLD